MMLFFFSSRRRHTRLVSDWSSDVCSSDLQAFHYAQSLERPEGGFLGGIWDEATDVEYTFYGLGRSEERRVGKECRSRWWPEDEKKREDDATGNGTRQ